MPQTQIAMGRAFTYLDNLGRIGNSSTTFWHPVGLGTRARATFYTWPIGATSLTAPRA